MATCVAGACWDGGCESRGSPALPRPRRQPALSSAYTLQQLGGDSPQLEAWLLPIAAPLSGACSRPGRARSVPGSHATQKQSCGFTRATGVVNNQMRNWIWLKNSPGVICACILCICFYSHTNSALQCCLLYFSRYLHSMG